MMDDISTIDAVDSAVRAADHAAAGLAAMTPTERARTIESAAAALDTHADELVELADVESHLGPTRLRGELARTTFQLRCFADEVRSGVLYDARIDPADPQWPTGPRPDLRRVQIPLGPVLVFAASNFPFAFSVAGGDTASAWAAGCPVVVKAHPGHPRLSRRVAQVLTAVLPEGMLTLIEGVEQGTSALLDPRIAAAAFTGSVRGGLALAGVAAGREVPIPFFGELGSINPVVVFPGAADGDDLASGYVTSLTLGAGQFCTNPGLLFVPADCDLPDRAAELVRAGGEPARMLTPAIAEAYRADADRLAAVDGVTTAVSSTGSGPGLLVTELDTFRTHLEDLAHECFGPLGLIVRYHSTDELCRTLRALPGQLTSTVHANDQDDPAAVSAVVDALQTRCGRLLWNQWPTGVSVTSAMQHGGPYPATTAASTTSVGTAAAGRFSRPVAYQNWPTDRLPTPLRDDNPWQVPQRRG